MRERRGRRAVRRLALFLLCLGWSAPGWAVTFTASDRVLVIAPHPDDESLGTGGLLQAAVSAGARVLVVFLTHGDQNELSSLVRLGRPPMTAEDFIRTGLTRRSEALRAAGELGLTESDLVFFGYPDQGLLGMWRRHWDARKPFRSYRTRIDRVPYRDSFSHGNPHTAAHVLQDLGRVLTVFRPTRVLVTAPFDLHPDHRAAYLYLTAALWEREERSESPDVLVYLVHAPHWPYPPGDDPASLRMSPPPIRWAGESHEWTELALTAAQTQTKRRAIEAHESQVAARRKFLFSFARASELFTRVAEDAPGRAPSQPGASFALQDGRLVARVLLESPLASDSALTVELFGWSPERDFTQMPKIALEWKGGRLGVRDKGRSVYGSGARARPRGRWVRFEVPMRLLGDPERVFCSVHAGSDARSGDFGAWRILLLENGPEPESSS